MISPETKRLLHELTKSSGFVQALQEVSGMQSMTAVNECRAAVARGDLTAAALAEGRARAWESMKATLTDLAG